ncbi:MAG TPA: hypothetical protein VFI37_07775 [Gaiellaceae bacterium]|jgi:dipeptidyl aminopeptidase/acylaminoacyl peptidase|nr:hypothetical protein [Gaiellaceae bacterium]
MSKALAWGAVGAAYTLLFGFLIVLVVVVTAAVSDGWKVRQAAQRLDDSQPRFSPDGSQIAWIRNDADGDRLWVMEADGSGQQPLAAATRFRWARNGAALLFSRGGPRVFRVSLDDGIPVGAGRGSLAPVPARDESRGRQVFSRDHRLYLRLRDGSEQPLT